MDQLNSWITPALTDSISGLFFYERKRRDTSFNKILCKLDYNNTQMMTRRPAGATTGGSAMVSDLIKARDAKLKINTHVWIFVQSRWKFAQFGAL